MHDKPTLRMFMRERLRGMEESTRHAASVLIAAHLKRLSATWPAGVTVALFGGLKNEPDLVTHLLPALHAQGVSTCFFQIEHQALQARQVRSMDDLHRGQMNVWEPNSHCPAIDVAALDIILVPGLAFTHDGKRLGRGGGYYDRLLGHPQCRAERIAVAFDVQLVDHITVEFHDEHIHQIITESGLIQA
ncbi:5-formyltetrahydrofolate cyclo-ligase [Prosthecobacter sp.]|uniref:5-formyltetrahydrofolate cyclo-ligase n=1 Tax=Prosthecobacter sp. TaxID=1965333 RepID=UPI00248736B9|nr:5-formyltetrahydrofolate cyclo-ligase [Prosthecobacter sp.]MDI1315381.1 5-formyltetrahydrofolate cyclo-ligase [Prosthecobacter sp.]